MNSDDKQKAENHQAAIPSNGNEYNFNRIEKKWQKQWKSSNAYRVPDISNKPKYYVLDMFPYPSGAGLHVGHPLGYIASDIFSRYKRLKGFNVLHPMGFDSFGLPAEQYALDTGQHPAVTTKKNIETFKAQLDNIGFCFDWEREVQTSDPEYYKWTQWIFLQLFNSYYNRNSSKATPLTELIKDFELEGNRQHVSPGEPGLFFNENQWNAYSESEKMNILMQYRICYCGIGEVNWCEALGTVLANDEVVNGVSERGSFPVVKKKLRQWYLRITEYADRLLEGLNTVEFSDAMKEMQTNWIGKSSGAEIDFGVDSTSVKVENLAIRVYTTRPDTIFGVDFMVIAPEHELVSLITTDSQSRAVEEYIAYVNSRSERERMAEKKISGEFTGAFAINPFDGRKIPVWISEYVLAGYGTGAIMAVPCGDERDFKFAKYFGIPVTNIIGDAFNETEANPTKDAVLQNSSFLDGMVMKGAIDVVIKLLEEKKLGIRKINYKLRDAAFSRQRYWGEPFPVKWINGIAYALPENELPLQLPHVDSYKPGPEGEGPLANINEWTNQNLETNTMPGYAGSSWYFLRYMDPQNSTTFCDRKISDYWNQVDLYIGGTEHAVGHLLYSRMWTKVLFDLGHIGFDEPFRRLLNQGMIQGSSRFVYRIENAEDLGSGTTVFKNVFISKDILDALPGEEALATINKALGLQLGSEVIINTSPIHVDVNLVDGVELNINEFKEWKPDFAEANFITGRDGKYYCGSEIEKMSKSKFNTVNPDQLVEKYGADTFRMYEMFLGPVEMSKPWDTKGIEGVHRFLRKFWRLFSDEIKGNIITDEPASPAELKILHNAIRKIENDTERFSFNTAVSAFMIATNELTDIGCHKRAILQPLLILLVPYAPHIAEELWHILGNKESILDAVFPDFDEKLVKETTKTYPVAVNGKTRHEITLPLDISQKEVEEIIKADVKIQKYLEGKTPKKIIYVKNKMINVVV